MKRKLNLEEVIDNLPGQGMQPGPIFAKRRFNEAVEYFDGIENIPETIQERMIESPLWVDAIEENLKTHDYRQMLKQLQQRWPTISLVQSTSLDSEGGKEFTTISNVPDFSRPESIKDYVKTLDLVKSNEFQKIVEFFNYSISSVEGNTVQLEPIYPESVEKFINTKCHNVLFHVTTEDVAEKIVHLGLRCKNGATNKGGAYRAFPKRIYMLGYDFEKWKKQDIVADILKKAVEVFHMRGPFVIFRCTGQPGMYYYRDTAVPECDNAFFTYVNIPPEKLKRIY